MVEVYCINFLKPIVFEENRFKGKLELPNNIFILLPNMPLQYV